MQVPYRDRQDGGRALAARLTHLKGRDPVILGIPRGGVPVAFEVAARLGAPLDVFIVRKLGYPGHEELAIGAIASGEAIVLNDAIAAHVPAAELARVIEREKAELVRREQMYRKLRPPLELANRWVVLVDDGLATGASMLVAVKALRMLRPARVIGAVPVAPPDTCELLAQEVDEMICAATPEPFEAVGLWYEVFNQTSDAEVRSLLAAAERISHPARSTHAGGP
jgi:putative phosphoribosyl transferase